MPLLSLLCAVARLASDGRDDLVEQLHAGALPDLLDDGSQLLIGLFKVTFSEKCHTVTPIHERGHCGGSVLLWLLGSTFCFDLERRPDQREESGVKGDGSVAVQRHVHPNQALQTGGIMRSMRAKAVFQISR